MEYLPGPVLPATVSPLMRQPNTPFWEIPTMVGPPACTTDQLISTFIQNCRRISQTKTLDAILRPPTINVKTFVEYTPPSPTRPAPAIQMVDLEQAIDAYQHRTLPSSTPGMIPQPMVDLLTNLADHSGMTQVLERLGIFVPTQRVLSWLAHPTRDSYNSLVPQMVPRASQLTIPHSHWIDFVLQGPLRDAIIDRQDLYANQEFQSVYASALRLVNWPGRPIDALHVDQASGEMWLTEAFVAHAMRLENWRMHESFAQRYPELRGHVDML